MITKNVKFVFAVTLQVLIIFAIIIFKVSILTGGTEVILQIEPVDPRSPLRGDYVTFQYEISNIPGYLVEDDVKNGDTIYVVLSGYGAYWGADYATVEKPTNEIFIKGRIASGADDVDNNLDDGIDPFDPRGGRFGGPDINVVYGIEEYFIPEGKGRGFSFFDKEANALVVVDDDGNPVLKQIFIDGEPWP